MSARTKTQINVLTRQAIVRRSVHDACKAWCEHCLDVVFSMTLEAAANLLQTPSRTLFALLETGKLHVVEAGAKLPLVCCNSISTNPTETEILIQGDRRMTARQECERKQ